MRWPSAGWTACGSPSAGFTNLSRDHLDFHPTMGTISKPRRGCSTRLARCTPHRGGASTTTPGGRWRRAPGDRRAVTVSVEGGPADWRAGVTVPTAGAASSPPSTPPGCTTGCGIRLPGGTTSPMRCWRWPADAVGCLPGTGLARAAGRHGARPAGGDRPGQDFLAVVDYAHKPGALAGGAGDAAPQPNARLAVVFGAGGNRDPASANRWGASPPNWPTWWSSPTTTRATRTRPPSRPCWRGRDGRRPDAEVVEIGDRRAASTTRWPGPAGRRRGDRGQRATSRADPGGQTRPFDDRDEVGPALQALGTHP